MSCSANGLRINGNHTAIAVALVMSSALFGSGCASLLTSTDPSNRIFALHFVSDQSVLERVAETDEVIDVRVAAVRQMSDQAMLRQFAEDDSVWEVRQAAFQELDRGSLATLANTTRDPAVALAAKVQLNQTTWNQVFADARRSNVDLGDALGAAALADNPNISTVTVVKACHDYIRQGDASRIPELRALLMRYGNMTLAEDYLNCGRRELKEAGAAWARQNGYSVGTGFGSSRVRWGSGR